MKLPSSYPYTFTRAPLKRRPALDVSVSPQKTMVLAPSIRKADLFQRHPSLTASRRVVDGAYKEKSAFLTELKERSLQDTLWRFFRTGELLYRRGRRIVRRCVPSLAPQKMLYGSLVGGIAFGMVSMAFMEHFFGPGVFAGSRNFEQVSPEPSVSQAVALDEESEPVYDSGSDIFFEYFNETADEKYKDNVRAMVKGYPIEEMLPYIFEQDRLTAAFLIGIAKKESNWGKRVPVLDAQDCFNYWGYRGVRRMMGSGGHTCFNSKKDAVMTVAKRLNTLINSEKLNTPEKMIVWKCGFSCAGHSRESVKKWISDVDGYFKELSEE